MRLETYIRIMNQLGLANCIGLALLAMLLSAYLLLRFVGRETLVTLFYGVLYLVASPTAILLNKILMKDTGFGYPIMVSSLGQLATAITACTIVACGGATVENGRKVPWSSLLVLGCSTALALVLGQYPYLYLTVAFIQMLKAFSPTYMVLFLYCLGVEYPSRRVIACVLGLSASTAIASAGEVNFHLIGVLFMMAASCSDAMRLVLAQKLLSNLKLQPIEALYLTAPICLLWMLPAACIAEIPTARRTGSFHLVSTHPAIFVASAASGAFVNFTSFLLVKRTSSMTLKALTMARNGGLVIVSALVFGETITALEAVGYSGLLTCFALYTATKASEAQQPQGQK